MKVVSVEPQEDKITTSIINNDLDTLQSLFDSDYTMPVISNVTQITTPVYLAVQYNHIQILEFLLDLDTGDLDATIPGWFCRTACHRAAFDGRQDLLQMLLDAGANPAPKDIHGKTPYILGNQNIRDFLRRYAGENPQKYDWQKLGITPLTPEIEDEKKQKLAEKKRRKKQNAKKNQQEKKVQDQIAIEKEKLAQQEAALQKKISDAAAERASKIANLSEREKRALAAENRIRGNARPCDFCKNLLTMVPFERLEFKYCTVECVRRHMDQLEMIAKEEKNLKKL